MITNNLVLLYFIVNTNFAENLILEVFGIAAKKKPFQRSKIRVGEPIRLADLFHRCWTVPAIAAIHEMKGARFVVLLNHLATNRPALKQSLEEAINHGWIVKNPGYGHPLRPEYILPAKDKKFAPACSNLVNLLGQKELRDICLRKWSMPILHSIGSGNSRFSDIRTHLGSITDRALTLGLKDLVAVRLISREVVDTFPPTTKYDITSSGKSYILYLNQLSNALED